MTEPEEPARPGDAEPDSPDRQAPARNGPDRHDSGRHGANPDRAELIARFLAGDGRERRALLAVLRPELTRDEVARLAPALRDATPKIAARLISLLARHGLRGEFEAQLRFVKPAHARQLLGHFDRYRRNADSSSGTSRARNTDEDREC